MASQVQPYSFKNSNYLSHAHLEGLGRLNSDFAALVSPVISTLLSQKADLSVVEISQGSLSKILKTLSPSSCYSMVNISSMSKHCLITVSHDLAYRIVECLLGNEPGYPLHAHTFQPLEMAILRQFIQAILPPLKDVWKPYLEITTHIHEMGTNLVALQKKPQAPTYAIVTFKIIFSATTGYLNLIYPCESIFPIRQQLDNLSTLEQALNPQNIELTLKAILGSLHLTPEELFHLKIGDVLKTEHRLGQPIDLQAENAPMMLCYPGLIYKHKGVILA